MLLGSNLFKPCHNISVVWQAVRQSWPMSNLCQVTIVIAGFIRRPVISEVISYDKLYLVYN